MYMGEKKSPFTNRELSWLDFNVRVLEEAERERNPVLERLKFLSITASNLDEFYMVRVASIKEKIQDKETEPDESGLTPEENLAKIRKKAGNFVARQYACYEKHILPDLEKAGIRLVPPDGLDENQYKAVSDYFYNMVFPVLTPIAVDKSRPLPLLLNKAVYIAVRLRRENKSYFALVQVPTVLPRHFELPCQEGRAFILLEDIITYFLSSLFELHIIEAHALFRVTRNSDLEVDEDAENLLTAMKKTLEKRKRGAPVRLELQQECDEKLREFLLEALHVSRKDVVDIPGPMALAGFMKFAMMPGARASGCPPSRRWSRQISWGWRTISPPSESTTGLSIIPMKASMWWWISCGRPPRTRMCWPSSRPSTGSAASPPLSTGSSRPPRTASRSPCWWS